MVTTVETLAAVGALCSSVYAYKFLSFLWFYLGKPSTIESYLHGPKPYALVTGATDGIGKAIAQELYRKGFSLILHGRNEEKMRKVVADIRKAGSESQDVRYFLADAMKGGHDFGALTVPFSELHITLVVHNVGGTIIDRERIDAWSEDALLSVLRWNVLFPIFLTRTLLPTLRRAAKSGPVLVDFIGSQATVACPPRLSMYAGSKAFLEKFARVLDKDEAVMGEPTGVHFQYLSVGEVSTHAHRVDVTLASPSPETFAKAVVARMGGNNRVVIPYMIHAVMQWAMELIGERAIEPYAVKSIEQMFEEHAKNA